LFSKSFIDAFNILSLSAMLILLNFRVPAEFEIAIGIGIEIGSGNVRLTPIFDSDFDPDFKPQLSGDPKVEYFSVPNSPFQKNPKPLYL
jgi:hypothetical protein